LGTWAGIRFGVAVAVNAIIPKCSISIRTAPMADISLSIRCEGAREAGRGMPTKAGGREDRAGARVEGRKGKVAGTLRVPWRTASGACLLPGLLNRHDQYFKRRYVGIIYQLNVAPPGLANAGWSRRRCQGDVREGGIRCRLVLRLVRRRTSRRIISGAMGFWVRGRWRSGRGSSDKGRVHISGSGDSRGRCDDALLVPAADDGREHIREDRRCCR